MFVNCKLTVTKGENKKRGWGKKNYLWVGVRHLQNAREGEDTNGLINLQLFLPLNVIVDYSISL